MKKALLIAFALLAASEAMAESQTKTVPLSASSLIAYLESDLSCTNEASVELKIQKINKQMKLLDHVTNAHSPQLWQYRHDKLEYVLGCLYLESGDKPRAYRHLKTCIWNGGQYDIHARRILETQFKTADSNQVPGSD